MINFKIIIPVYNAEKWVGKCLNSVINQNYKNWKAIVIDDNSTDGTLEEIKNTLKDRNVSEYFKVLKRSINVGAMENIVYGITVICKEDNEVILLLDGDDWLASNDVLSYLNEIYSSENIWMTYGSFTSDSGMHNSFCKQIKSTENYRHEEWVTSHLRTFKYWLWKKIDVKDFKDSMGNFYSMAWDQSIMFPLIEMSGLDRIKFIEKILYIYNDNNPNNDFRKNAMKQITMANEIRNKVKYRKIK